MSVFLRSPLFLAFASLTISVFCQTSAASDWTRFRGPNGSGVSPDEKPVPTKWSTEKNMKWSIALPGPGSSSPIVIGERVFVTCWSGYGTSGNNGNQEQLKRHLVCVNRTTGKTMWEKSVDPHLPEDRYGGMFAENGYASHTPVSDGKNVFAFFGKTGIVAFDMDGKQLWKKSVGTESGAKNWGSASSPILHKDLVIVPATAESQSIVALNKETGEEVWKAAAGGFSATWGSPVLVDCGNGRIDLVLSVPFEIWGFDPDTGKLRWYCDGIQSDSMCSSVVAHNGIVYAIEAGPRGGGAIAVKAGGKSDVTKSHVLWTTRDRSRIGSPLYHDDRIHWISSKIANCVDAKTGDRIYQSRLGGGSSSSAGGSRGGRGGQDYGSPVIASGHIYYATRGGSVFVVKLGKEFELVAENNMADGGDFSSTPAISNGELFIRSSKKLYCISADDK